MTPFDEHEDDIIAFEPEGLDAKSWQDAEIIDEIEDVDKSYYADLVIIHREWTIQTIADQVKRGNIELDPPYQRRSVWTDRRRSLLIDSLMIGLPVPEIVLAEIPGRRGKYAVIDGKQRLQTITGYLFPKDYPNYWNRPKLTFTSKAKAASEKGILSDELHGKAYSDLDEEQKAALENTSIRCTFLTNYKNEIVLYTLFHRLNSQSVPLNMQELRQALYHGEFSRFITESTANVGPIHEVMGLKRADNRLRDTELLLRYIAISLFGSEYKGNLRQFLDDAMRNLNQDWIQHKTAVERAYEGLNQGIKNAERVLGDIRYVGRRLANGKFETRFNKVLFEVQVYYFARLGPYDFSDIECEHFREAFATLLQNSAEFNQAIGDTTKGLNEYRTRYTAFQGLFQETFGVMLHNPFPMPTLK